MLSHIPFRYTIYSQFVLTLVLSQSNVVFIAAQTTDSYNSPSGVGIPIILDEPKTVDPSLLMPAELGKLTKVKFDRITKNEQQPNALGTIVHVATESSLYDHRVPIVALSKTNPEQESKLAMVKLRDVLIIENFPSVHLEIGRLLQLLRNGDGEQFSKTFGGMGGMGGGTGGSVGGAMGFGGGLM